MNSTSAATSSTTSHQVGSVVLEGIRAGNFASPTYVSPNLPRSSPCTTVLILTSAQQEFPSFSALCDHITRYHGQLQGEDVPIANRAMGWSQQPPSPDNPFRQPPPLVPYEVEQRGGLTIRERVHKKKIKLTVAEDGTKKDLCAIL